LKRELDGLITQMHSAGVSYTEAVRQFKRRYILEVLSHHKGNQCKAAEELGMHRNTLSRTLAELELDTTKIRNGMRRPVMSERPRTLAVVSGTSSNVAKMR
jgi:Fis family transcriptional regulator